jgi:hypothetical protein
MPGAPVKMIAWNIAQRADAWRWLVDSDADIALLQEAKEPPAEVAAKVSVDPAPWRTGASRAWRAAVVKLSDRIDVEWIDAKSLGDAQWGELGVSRPGTLAAATVTPLSGEPFIAVSVYGAWENPHSMTKSDFIYADASVHRLISDMSVFAGKNFRQPILVAGDLNILYGHGEHGDAYWAGRYETVFSRMAALGLKFVGPQAPHGWRGRALACRASAHKQECSHLLCGSPDAGDVHPSTGLRFASDHLAERVRVGAQRTGSVGTERPLPRGDRGWLRRQKDIWNSIERGLGAPSCASFMSTTRSHGEPVPGSP